MRSGIFVLAMALSATVTQADGLDAIIGKALFEREWVGAPASTDSADGLGPLFNGRSCASCHHAGGPARFGSNEGNAGISGLAVRVAQPDGTAHPGLGRQIQDGAVAGLVAEGSINARLIAGELVVSTRLLNAPTVPAIFETRVAPSLRGTAALGQIANAAILSRADPDDHDGDGISGRPHVVLDPDGGRSVGRYGSKASVESLMNQMADAAALDLGLSSPLARLPWGDCTRQQIDCLTRPTGRSHRSEGEELSVEVLRLLASYVETLEARPADLKSEGFRQFEAMGCAVCHVPVMPAEDGTPLQVFSDLLLHDMGRARSSVIREGSAAPAEWRTAPLRDLAPASGARRYLHDGKAATLADAIALHGGEAESARRAFLDGQGREQRLLLEFLSRL
ncbi:MAG: hypothetical protein KDK89_01950 [Alphaproteobacteria bacterium]|nr:hypothetical protein [Alphaproteobacteria bacterium]